jgi:CSLREA domain-containing protein
MRSRVTTVIAAGLLVGGALAAPVTAGSTDFDVTKTADTNDGSCTIADCSLREAIIAGNVAGADSIQVPAGVYKLTIDGDDDLAATGDLDIRKGMSIFGAGARSTIIDGNGIDRVFHTPYQNTSTPFFVNLSNMKVKGGVTDGLGGGILHEADDATLNIQSSTIVGNVASGGGGIHTQRGPTLVERSTVSNNKAPGGSGGGIRSGSGSTLTVDNSTISGNRSKFGGGIMTYASLDVIYSTIAFNTAQQPGGGIFRNSGTVTLNSSIVSNNQSDFANAKNCSGPFTSSGNNIEKGTSCGFTAAGDLNADPQLAELANNNGPTNTHKIRADSPCIDAGSFSFPPTDQRGVGRPQGPGPDMGAYERFFSG